MASSLRTTLIALSLLLGTGLATAQPLKYPQTRKVDQVDDYHGLKVSDPYRWLEDDNSAETAAWVGAQNEVSFGYLKMLPHREPLRTRLTQLWNFERYGAPFIAGGKYFFTKNDGLQNHAVMYVQESLAGEPRVLTDPNTLSADGSVSIASSEVTDDGSLMAYSISRGGSDWREIRVRDVATGRDLPDVINWVKNGGVTWTKDGKGFFYARYPEVDKTQSLKQSNRDQKIYYHYLGTPQSQDILVYERPDQPTWFLFPAITEDGRYFVIYVSQGGRRTELYYSDMVDPMKPQVKGKIAKLVGGFEGASGIIDNDGTTFYAQTDIDAPHGRVVAIDITKPEKSNWKTIIPEGKDVMESVILLGNQFVVNYMHDAHNRVLFYDMNGRQVKELDLPTVGSVNLNGRRYDREIFYTFTSYLYPTTVFRYDVAKGTSEIFRTPKIDFDPSRYETKQVWYTSKDGTKVPMFITHRRGLKLDGTNPTILYGYGGFGVPMTPAFSITNLLWIDNGGVYVVANLRGGGEFGNEWHQAGTTTRKQNVFDDFIAAAEDLIAKGYTSPKKLAISGRSNGGLLVGAAMCQRPDLFGVALPAVGVMDMLRYDKFTVGRAWGSDYGLSENPEEFKALHAYSPLHNLKPGTTYPATLVTTADHDDRVVPAHSFKFAARLQECHAGEQPVLIRVTANAGHGSGRSTAVLIDESADVLAFTMYNLGMAPPLY